MIFILGSEGSLKVLYWVVPAFYLDKDNRQKKKSISFTHEPLSVTCAGADG